MVAELPRLIIVLHLSILYRQMLKALFPAYLCDTARLQFYYTLKVEIALKNPTVCFGQTTTWIKANTNRGLQRVAFYEASECGTGASHSSSDLKTSMQTMNLFYCFLSCKQPTSELVLVTRLRV